MGTFAPTIALLKRLEVIFDVLHGLLQRILGDPKAKAQKRTTTALETQLIERLLQTDECGELPLHIVYDRHLIE